MRFPLKTSVERRIIIGLLRIVFDFFFFFWNSWISFSQSSMKFFNSVNSIFFSINMYLFLHRVKINKLNNK